MLVWYYFVNFNVILEVLSISGTSIREFRSELRKRNAPGVAFLHTQNANKDSELSVGPMSLDFSQWQDESLFYMPIEL